MKKNYFKLTMKRDDEPIKRSWINDLSDSLYDFLQCDYKNRGKKVEEVACIEEFEITIPDDAHIYKDFETFAAYCDCDPDDPNAIQCPEFDSLTGEFNGKLIHSDSFVVSSEDDHFTRGDFYVCVNDKNGNTTYFTASAAAQKFPTKYFIAALPAEYLKDRLLPKASRFSDMFDYVQNPFIDAEIRTFDEYFSDKNIEKTLDFKNPNYDIEKAEKMVEDLIELAKCGKLELSKGLTTSLVSGWCGDGGEPLEIKFDGCLMI